MKKRSILCLLLTIFVFCSVLAPAAYAQEEDTYESFSACKTLDATTSMLGASFVLDNAEAALLYELNTDTMLYDMNIDAPVYPSSLTKIMTALIVLENSTLNEIVVARQDTLESIPYDAASANIVVDEVMSVENLLYCMLVDSANDAAAVLACHVGGSQAAFVEMMNKKAEELGCTGTHFENVHGLHSDGHISTARDIAKIVEAAIESEDFVRIFGTDYYTIPATNKSDKRILVTGNYLMTRSGIQIYHDSRVTGGRTGVTYDDKRCITTTAERRGMKVICVIMGSESVVAENGYYVISFGGFEETTELLDLCYNQMAPTLILQNDQALKRYTVANGDCDLTVCPQVDVFAILPNDITAKDLTYRYGDVSTNPTAPIEKGQKISTVEVIYDGLTIAQGDLFAMNSVAVQQTQAAFNAAGSGKKTISFWPLILAIIAVLVIFLFGSRFAHRLRLASRRKRVQNKHRRSR